MTTRDDFTEAEWQQVKAIVLLAPGNMMANVGPHGPLRAVREGIALVAGLSALSRDPRYQASALIQAAVSEDEYRDADIPALSYEESMAFLREAVAVLDRIAPAEDALLYKQFVLDLTRHVANAFDKVPLKVVGYKRMAEQKQRYIADLKALFGLS